MVGPPPNDLRVLFLKICPCRQSRAPMLARAASRLSRLGAVALRGGQTMLPAMCGCRPAVRQSPLLGLRGLCAVSPGGASTEPRAPGTPAEERIWILGKTWSAEKGRFITEAELRKMENSTRSQRRTWAKLAKCRARRKRRRVRRAAGRYNF